MVKNVQLAVDEKQLVVQLTLQTWTHKILNNWLNS